MRTGPLVVALVLMAGLLGAGCAGPVLTVRHTLPAAVPLPADATGVAAKGFSVAPAEKSAYGQFATERLAKRVAEAWPGGAGAVEVGVEIGVDAKDVAGKRTVREWNRQSRAWESREVATLVRTAAVDVDFVVTGVGGKRLVVVESRRAYDSSEDPRVRGRLGLDRPDDPDNVPPEGQIVRELLAQCVDSFCEMIAPHTVTATVPLRGTLRSDGSAGLKAAGQGDYEAAVRHLEAAVAAAPSDVNLLFDLAAVCEMKGDLAAAVTHYKAVVDRTQGRDRDAVEGAQRAERVLKRLPK